MKEKSLENELKKMSMIDSPNEEENEDNDPKKKELLPEEEGYGVEEYIEMNPPNSEETNPPEQVQGI